MSENNKKYGEAWRAELMKWRKSEIIDFLKDALVCNRIHQWHYPSKGELPVDTDGVLVCTKDDETMIDYYHSDTGWEISNNDDIVAWQYIEPPKEM